MSHEAFTSDQLGTLHIDRATGRVIGGPAFQMPGVIDHATRERTYSRLIGPTGQVQADQQRETIHLWRSPLSARGADQLCSPGGAVGLWDRLVDLAYFCIGVPFLFGLGMLGWALAHWLWPDWALAGVLGFFAVLTFVHSAFVRPT